MMTEPRTLYDVIQAGEAAPYESRIEYIEHSTFPHFRCRCGRLIPADLMLEVQPEGCQGVGERLCGHDRFRCWVCWRKWLEQGEMSLQEFRERVGLEPAPEGALW